MSEGVDSASHSVVEVLRSAPEPELETETVDHWITSTKLTMKSHRLRIPSKVPHRVRDVEKASREHGTSVRLDKKGKQVVNNT